MSGAEKQKKFRRILGLRFFNGTAPEALNMLENGGLLVVPAAPALKNLPTDPEYREALVNADLAITDSAFMVIVWNLMQKDTIRRLSGLEYLRELIRRKVDRRDNSTFWIMAGQKSAETNIRWLRGQGLQVPEDHCYIAPFYGREIDDPVLLEKLRSVRPKDIVVTIGGGNQERLGLYLKRELGFPAAIHCIGAAIAFLSGDQVHIPNWADRLGLGWLFRCVSDPKRYGPRYWEARHLMPLMMRYRERMPEIQA